MAGTEANTHSMFVRGTGGTTALTDTNVGSITLPAGGDWIIYNVWGYAVTNAAGAAEASMGHIRIVSASGDITPGPSPSRFPLAPIPSYLGAATGKPLVPLTSYDVNWTAAGKAVIEIHYINECAKTAGDVVCAGIIFGKAIPKTSRIKHLDRTTLAVSAAGSTTIGTITLAESATKIVGIGCDVVQNLVSTTAEEILPYWSLTSDDVDFAPAQWPCSFASCIGLATNHGLNNAIVPKLIPVEIPIIGGARITCVVNLLAAVTNAAQASCYIAYE
jgi:hypothetical protein